MATRMITAKGSVAPIEDVTPIKGSQAGRHLFGVAGLDLDRSKMARIALINNETGGDIYVRLNPFSRVQPAGTPSWGVANTTNYDFKVADGAEQRLDHDGLIGIQVVSVWVPAGNTNVNYYIRGWVD